MIRHPQAKTIHGYSKAKAPLVNREAFGVSPLYKFPLESYERQWHADIIKQLKNTYKLKNDPT